MTTGPRVIDTLDELQSLAGGPPFATSPWLVLDQQKIDGFAAITGDRQWIHIDPERARRESPWGSTVAHGFLTLSLLSQMAFATVELRLGQTATLNYGLNKVRFPAPVPAGSRIRGHFELLGCGPRPGGIEVGWRVTVEAEGQDKPVCVADWVLRLMISGV